MAKRGHAHAPEQAFLMAFGRAVTHAREPAGLERQTANA